MADLENLRKLVEFMAKSLVDDPDRVEVTERAGENTTKFELDVAESDRGKVIGKQGRTAHAMRTILLAASTKIQERTVLEIME